MPELTNMEVKNIEVKSIIGPNQERLAYMKREAKADAITLVWLCGYHSDMSGSKASIMDEFASENTLGSLKFDYSGHGQSDGTFEHGTISKWLSEAQFMLDSLISGNVVLVGSSMGGWLALLLAINNPSKVCGMVLSAPAPDFTEDLMWAGFDENQKREIMETGFWLRPNDYDAPHKVTKELIEDGRNHLITNAQINIDVPIRIIHGMEDKDVPFMRSVDLVQKVRGQDVKLVLMKNGGHRLSEPNELLVLKAAINDVYKTIL